MTVKSLSWHVFLRLRYDAFEISFCNFAMMLMVFWYRCRHDSNDGDIMSMECLYETFKLLLYYLSHTFETCGRSSSPSMVLFEIFRCVIHMFWAWVMVVPFCPSHFYLDISSKHATKHVSRLSMFKRKTAQSEEIILNSCIERAANLRSFNSFSRFPPSSKNSPAAKGDYCERIVTISLACSFWPGLHGFIVSFKIWKVGALYIQWSSLDISDLEVDESFTS